MNETRNYGYAVERGEAPSHYSQPEERVGGFLNAMRLDTTSARISSPGTVIRFLGMLVCDI